MNQNIILTILEFGASLIVEGIILSMVFNWISNKETEKQQKILQQEMNNIEVQNKFIYEQLKDEMKEMKRELISQIKESTNSLKKG
jgi:hypothetical protein